IQLAATQIKLPFYEKLLNVAKPFSLQLLVEENAEQLEISSKNFKTVFSKINGELTSYRCQGIEYLLQGISPNLWRSSNDNEIGGGFVPENCQIWKNASKTTSLKKFNWKKEGDNIVISTHFEIADSALFTIQYSLNGDGLIIVDNHFEPLFEGLPVLPRIGITLQLRQEFDNMQWFGRGPQSSYPDRKESAFVDLYEGRVWEQYYPYARPQENGSKSDVRWLALTNTQGKGFLFTAPSLFSASAFNFPNEDLYDYSVGTSEMRVGQKRMYNISKKVMVTCNLDFKQMGIGGDTSWGYRAMPHPQFQIPAQSYNFRFILNPIDLATESPFKEYHPIK
ncbi:MAG: hypothetical protein HQ522_23125, partial [Bacteroidetes bacterium]|nr:hypothetical protein [Bacteroidota bacterium]